MDAVAFPPPPPPFLDDDFDFGDFTFASPPAPAAGLADPGPTATFAAFDDDWGDFMASPLGSKPDPSAAPMDTTSASSSWEKPRGPLPLSLFGADEEDDCGRGQEGPVEPPPTATAHQHDPSFLSNGSRPADLKDLIVGLYGSQPPPPTDVSAAEASAREEAEDDDSFEDDGWEFKAAPTKPADQDGGVGAQEGEIGKVEDVTKSLASEQEDWSLFTGVDEKLDHVQTTDHIESTGEGVKAFSYSPANSSAILNLYKESKHADVIQISQSSSDLFSSNELNSSFGTDENHSMRSTSDSILIDFYRRLRELSLTAISRHIMGHRAGQKSFSDENSKATEIGRDVQEINEKLQGFSLPKRFCTEEHASRDVCITDLLNSIKEEHMKDFEQEYHLAESIAQAMEDKSMAIELYKHSVSSLHTLELASKEEQSDYVSAWYSVLLSCAQELHYGAALWQESCNASACSRVVSEGGHCFIALGELYRVAQILYLSLHSFKPWILADPGMLSKMLACLDSCSNAWTSLEMALKMVVESNHLDTAVAKALMESMKNLNEFEVPNRQNGLPDNGIRCNLTLLQASHVPGMKLIIWNGDHYFLKVANLWANRVSSDPPQLSHTPVSSMDNAITFESHVE